MRFRIITDGKIFRIEQKGFFGWKLIGTHNSYYGSDWIDPYEFATDESAVSLIRFKFGSDAKIFRPWLPSMTWSAEGPTKSEQ